MWGFKLTPEQEQCLRDQAITLDQPGPVLHDFQMLLDFVESNKLKTAGKHRLLPMKFIPELDERLARPLKLGLQRPQLRSHPYLQGLYLLLRASGLGRIEGSGTSSPQLVLDPYLKTQWDQLNLTERYFQLFEAWLRFGRDEMVGESGPAWADSLYHDCTAAWRFLSESLRRFGRDNDFHIPGLYRRLYLLALMDLFGLIKVDHPEAGQTSTWYPRRSETTPFGDALFNLLLQAERQELGLDEQDEDENEDDQSPSTAPFGIVSADDDDDDEQDEDDEWDEEPYGLETPEFGLWQPDLQPYFPDWQHNLEFPKIEPRTGTFVFRVSLYLYSIWRLIAIPAEDTLDDLLFAILDSVNFDSDHLYRFSYRDPLGRKVTISAPEMSEGPWTSQVRIGTLPLQPGETMDMLFDFGDSWRFTIKLERVEPEGKLKKPKVLEKHGTPPEQYPSWDG